MRWPPSTSRINRFTIFCNNLLFFTLNVFYNNLLFFTLTVFAIFCFYIFNFFSWDALLICEVEGQICDVKNWVFFLLYYNVLTALNKSIVMYIICYDSQFRCNLIKYYLVNCLLKFFFGSVTFLLNQKFCFRSSHSDQHFKCHKHNLRP